MSENKLPPIKGFIETSLLDWPGHVCAVVFLPYCNLRCPYCHNHQLVLKPDAVETLHLDSILKRVKGLQDWIDGFCITGGEPTIHRTLPSLLKSIREAGFKAKLDTNGTQPEILEHLIAEQLVDHVAMDVKAPLDDTAYSRCAGVYVPAEIIAKSIEALVKGPIPSTFRCTVTPTLLDEDEICRLAQGLKEKGAEALSLQNFNPADPMEPDLRDVKPFTPEVLDHMQTEVNRILG